MSRNGKDKVNTGIVVAGVVIAVAVLAAWLVVSQFGTISEFFGGLARFFMPFILGGIIAYLLSPLCNKLEAFFGKRLPEKKRLSAPLALIISFLFAVLIIVALIMLVIPNVTKSLMQVINVLPGELEALNTQIYAFLENYPDVQEMWENASASVSQKIITWLQTDLLSSVTNVAGSAGTSLSALAGSVWKIVIGILLSVYLVSGRKRLATRAKGLLYRACRKERADLIMEEIRYADKMFNGFFVGRVVDSAIIGVICFIFTAICRFDSAVLISIIVGVTNIIPYFGPFIGMIPCALILFLENPLHCLIFLIFILILQVIDGNLLGPHILGQTTGISSFWVLFSVMFFGGLWGVVGMIVGVPLFAVIKDILQKALGRGMKNKEAHESQA